jgi:hypothetical protein
MTPSASTTPIPCGTCREFALADMVAQTERFGLYDLDPAEVRAALKAARKKTDG